MRSLVITVAVSACQVSAAQELVPGIHYDTIRCVADSSQSYALYLPKDYQDEKARPVIYCLDAAARGSVPVQRFRYVADEYGVVIAGSNNSRNGPWEPIIEALEFMTADVAGRVAIDKSRIYLAGFSGGARAAVGLAIMAKNVRGVIGFGAGFPEEYPPTEKVPFDYVGVVGNGDFNYQEMITLDSLLAYHESAHCLITFDGGHAWPDSSIASLAVRWMSNDAPSVCQSFEELVDDSVRQAELRIQSQIQEEYAAIAEKRYNPDRFVRSMKWWDRLVTEHIDSELGDEPLMSRRIIDYIWRTSYILFNNFKSAGDSYTAERYAEVWASAQPHSPFPWYQLFAVRLDLEDKRSALSALSIAADNGMKRWELVQQHPKFHLISASRKLAEIEMQINQNVR